MKRYFLLTTALLVLLSASHALTGNAIFGWNFDAVGIRGGNGVVIVYVRNSSDSPQHSGKVFVDLIIEGDHIDTRKVYIRQGDTKKVTFRVPAEMISVRGGHRVQQYVHQKTEEITQRKDHARTSMEVEATANVRGGGIGGNWGIHPFDSRTETITLR